MMTVYANLKLCKLTNTSYIFAQQTKYFKSYLTTASKEGLRCAIVSSSCTDVWDEPGGCNMLDLPPALCLPV